MRDVVGTNDGRSTVNSKSNFGSGISRDNSQRAYATVNGHFPKQKGANSHIANNLVQNMYSSMGQNSNSQATGSEVDIM